MRHLRLAVRSGERYAQAGRALGTVGGRIAGTHRPRANRSASASASASWLSPTMIGWIALGESQSCQPRTGKAVAQLRDEAKGAAAGLAGSEQIHALVPARCAAITGLAAVVKM